MAGPRLHFTDPVTLVGGGALDEAMLAEAMALAPILIAADGAGERLAAMGHKPAAVIGDMDSTLNEPALRQTTEVVALDEQETTDFEKCLYTVAAPLYLAAGFTGGRIDHTLAVFDVMLRRPEQPVILIGEVEVLALIPANRRIELEVGVDARVSFVALSEAEGLESTGLEWPIGGLRMAMGRQVGTSNRAVEARIDFSFDRPGVLAILERPALPALLRALATT
ncbi:MAG: thiamine diphosphokinase [Pseudomonadota bacterium]